MSSLKRAAPSRSSSPEVGPKKRVRIDHNDETKAQGEQEEKVEEAQEKEPKKHHEEARDHQELRVKEELGVGEEVGKNEEPGLQAIHVNNQSEPGVTAHNSRDPSSGFSREENDENLPPINLARREPREPREKEEESSLEIDLAINRLEAANSAPKGQDTSSSPSSKTGVTKSALRKVEVETATEEEVMVHNEAVADTTVTASNTVAEAPSCDSLSQKQTAAETIMTSVEPAEVAPTVASSTPANPSTDALESTDQDNIGSADSNIDDTNAQQLPVPRARSPRSPTPSLDPRIALWKDERRSYAGKITIDRNKQTASRTAHEASQAPLFINGVPQLTFFVDGSIDGLSSRTLDQGWTNGGYRVVFRNPFDDTVRFVSRDENPVRFLEKPRIKAYQQGVDNDYVLEEGEVYDGPSRVVDFTVLCFGSEKVFSVPQVELAAISQAQETAIRFIDIHQPPTSVVTIFSDALTVVERVERGVVDEMKGLTLKLWTKISNPLVRAIIWQSHYLRDRGCQVEITWSPRCSALGPSLADAAANVWRGWPEEELSQRQLAVDVRDGMLDKLNEETNELIRGA